MEALVLALIGLTLVGAVMYERHERRAERLERLNRESWEIYRASRRIHDETARALQSLFDQARSGASAVPPRREFDR